MFIRNKYKFHGIADSIMNFFTPAGGAAISPGPGLPPIAPAQSPKDASNGNANPTPAVTAASPGTDNNGVIPADGTNGAPTKTPLQAFEKLWEPNVGADGKPIPTSNNSSYLNVDSKAIMEAAKKTDFTKLVSPELLQRVSKGGSDGIAATLEIINSVGQASYGQAATAAAQMTNSALAKMKEDLLKNLPEAVRRLQTNETLRSENPMMNNPAVKPMIDMVQSQLATKYPNASAKELQTLANQYVSDFGAAFAPKPAVKKDTSETRGGQTDWSKFLES